MKTIALFGSTGKAGKILLNKLLAKEYNIRVLVRTPAKLKRNHPHLSVIQGDILDASKVLQTLEKSDVIINVIGHVKNCPADLQTRATENILSGMRKQGITRLIDLTGGGVKVQGDNPGLIDRFIVFIMRNLAGNSARNRLLDGENHVALISRSALEWTIVRAPVLLPGKAKGRTTIGMVGHIPGYSLTFEDLTNQIINILEDKSFVHQYPYITNG
jgi:putative NADH-flavin reductase